MVKNKKIAIKCHTCDDSGYIRDESYQTGKLVKVVCPECDGKKFVLYEKWIER